MFGCCLDAGVENRGFIRWLLRADRLTSQLSCSVVICTRNRLPDLTKCLEALSQQTRAPNQLILVDASEPPLLEFADFTRAYSEGRFAGSKLLYLQAEPGLTKQRNLGGRAAEGDIILFLDDDTEVAPDFIDEIVSPFEESDGFDGGMAAIQGIPSKPLERFLRRLFMLTHNHGSGNFMPSGLPAFPHGKRVFQRTEVLSGAAMAVRRSLLREHDFDERLEGYAYMEDVDFSRRVSREHELFFAPQAKLLHHWSRPRPEMSFSRTRMFVKHHGYLFFKNTFPHNPGNLVFFLWSLLGYLLLHVLRRDANAVRGVWVGSVDVINRWWKE